MDFELYDNLRKKLDHFKNLPFREGQVQGIEFITESQRLVKVLCSPTGSGKSLIGIVTGISHNKFCYLCSSKQLQSQIEAEFPEVKVMWGRNNFECTRFPGFMADECPYANVNTEYVDEDTRVTIKRCKGQCPYEVQKKAVRSHPYQVLNYPYMLYEFNFVGSFPGEDGYDIIICDEADMIESQLSNFIILGISKRMLDRLNIEPPGRRTAGAKDSLDVWKEWSYGTEKKIAGRQDHAQDMMETLEPEHPDFKTWNRELKTLENMMFKLGIFTDSMDETWLYDEAKDLQGEVKSWEFKPTYLSPELVERFFLRHSKSFVFMSATFPPAKILAKVLGLNIADIDYEELPTIFPAENRKVKLRPVADLSYKTFNADVGKAVKEIDNILEAHPDEKGLIHTVSYKLNKIVMDRCAHNGRLITHDSSDKVEQLDKYLNSDKPLVFVSPSSTRGLDLPGPLCRFQIIVKAPFQSLADKLVSARVFGSKVGNLWYKADMTQELIQAAGRAVRSADDYAVTYILDRQACNIILNNQKLFPRYFIEAVDVF